MDNTFIQEKLLPRLTFKPGLELTGFRTSRPCCASVAKPLKIVARNQLQKKKKHLYKFHDIKAANDNKH